MEIGPLLRRSREAAGLTLDESAERCGMSRATLSAYERGAQVPGLARAEQILADLGLRLVLSVESLGAALPEEWLAGVDDRLLALLADLDGLPCVVEPPSAGARTVDLLVARDAPEVDSLIRWAGRNTGWLRVRQVDRLPAWVPVRVGEHTVRVLATDPHGTD